MILCSKCAHTNFSQLVFLEAKDESKVVEILKSLVDAVLKGFFFSIIELTGKC